MPPFEGLQCPLGAEVGLWLLSHRETRCARQSRAFWKVCSVAGEQLFALNFKLIGF